MQCMIIYSALEPADKPCPRLFPRCTIPNPKSVSDKCFGAVNVFVFVILFLFGSVFVFVYIVLHRPAQNFSHGALSNPSLFEINGQLEKEANGNYMVIIA